MPNLDVGRYAAYVWPAYGLSAVVVAALIADSLARARRWRKAVERDRAKPSPRQPSLETETEPRA